MVFGVKPSRAVANNFLSGSSDKKNCTHKHVKFWGHVKAHVEFHAIAIGGQQASCVVAKQAVEFLQVLASVRRVSNTKI